MPRRHSPFSAFAATLFAGPLLAAVLLATFPPSVRAASPAIAARLTAALIVANATGETAESAERARPGDVVEYTAAYTNRGDADAFDVTPTIPVPPGTEYLAIDARPKPSLASIDGVSYAPIPLRRTVRAPDGTTRAIDVPPREYRALRWKTGRLSPGAEVVVRARVRVTPPDSSGPALPSMSVTPPSSTPSTPVRSG